MLCVAGSVLLPLVLELVVESVTLALSLAVWLELWLELELELAVASDSKVETLTTAVAVLEPIVDSSDGTVVLNSFVIGAIGAKSVVAGVLVPTTLVSGC